MTKNEKGQVSFRYYRLGDEVQMADLFNRAFQMNGGGIVRTPLTWKWRYVQSPSFEPEQVQIAEDVEEKKIVGAIIVNLVEYIPIDGKKYLVGDINDVSCHPEYTGRGIANKLMEMAINYMEKKGCDISMLSADYNGFPRKKIYLKYGYKDVDRESFFLQFPNLYRLGKDLPFAWGLFPILCITSYIPRFWTRIKTKRNPFFKNISYEICHDRAHYEYAKAANRLIPKNYSAFPPHDNEKIKWSRINVPIKCHRATYILMKKNSKIIGGALITHFNMYAFKYGVKFRMGYIHEIFLDEEEFEKKGDLILGYAYLIDKVLKAATQRFIGILIHLSPSNYNNLHTGFKKMNFLNLKGGAIMIKIIKPSLEFPRFTKPIYMPAHSSLGLP